MYQFSFSLFRPSQINMWDLQSGKLLRTIIDAHPLGSAVLHVMVCNEKRFNLENELCSSRALWPLAPNFCPWVTRKSPVFHTNHMLGTLDFTVSEHWAPFNFP